KGRVSNRVAIAYDDLMKTHREKFEQFALWFNSWYADKMYYYIHSRNQSKTSHEYIQAHERRTELAKEEALKAFIIKLKAVSKPDDFEEIADGYKDVLVKLRKKKSSKK